MIIGNTGQSKLLILTLEFLEIENKLGMFVQSPGLYFKSHDQFSTYHENCLK